MQHPAKVSDEGFARAPAEQQKKVDSLQAKEAQATDAIARCGVAIRAAKNEVEAPQPELKASDALVEQALAARKQGEGVRPAREKGAGAAPPRGGATRGRRPLGEVGAGPQCLAQGLRAL